MDARDGGFLNNWAGLASRKLRRDAYCFRLLHFDILHTSQNRRHPSNTKMNSLKRIRSELNRALERLTLKPKQFDAEGGKEQVFVPSSRADYCRLARDPGAIRSRKAPCARGPGRC